MLVGLNLQNVAIGILEVDRFAHAFGAGGDARPIHIVLCSGAVAVGDTGFLDPGEGFFELLADS